MVPNTNLLHMSKDFAKLNNQPEVSLSFENYRRSPEVFRRLPKITERLPEITEDCQRSCTRRITKITRRLLKIMRRLPKFTRSLPKNFQNFGSRSTEDYQKDFRTFSNLPKNSCRSPLLRVIPLMFSCALLISDRIVFLVQFGINLHSRVFQKSQIADSPKRFV